MKTIELKCGECNNFFIKSLRVYKKRIPKKSFCSKVCAAKNVGHRDKSGNKNPNYGNGHKILKEKNPNWRGGSTYTIKQIRKSLDYINWRKDVLKRDNYCCIQCKSIENLEVDHIKPLSKYLELALDINNGRTLCKSCNIKTDTYGVNIRKI